MTYEERSTVPDNVMRVRGAFFFKWQNLQHMEDGELGTESEPQLWPVLQLQQHWIL